MRHAFPVYSPAGLVTSFPKVAACVLRSTVVRTTHRNRSSSTTISLRLRSTSGNDTRPAINCQLLNGKKQSYPHSNRSIVISNALTGTNPNSNVDNCDPDTLHKNRLIECRLLKSRQSLCQVMVNNHSSEQQKKIQNRKHK